MVRIRLRRMGAKKKAFYRIVIADGRSPRDGRFIETIGTYNPHTNPETVELRRERAVHWLGVGASPSEGVVRLLRRANLIDAKNRPVPQQPVEAPVAASVEAPVAAPVVAPVEASAAAVPAAA